MITVETREQIRRAYYIEHKSVRQIAREMRCSRASVDKAITSAEPARYTLTTPRSAPVLGAYKAVIDQHLADNERLPRKQRYTSHKIYEALRAQGYQGAESTVRGYISQQRRQRQRPAVFIPLEFDPGGDAQVDWGEAQVKLSGELVTVQLFVMRLCYSRRIFVMAFPSQCQEAFFAAHVQAFHHFQGVPRRLTYDNLATAVRRVLEGRTREEQRAFVAFRSHYLFDSHFCPPGQGHEKGGVEHGVGFARRNFLVPIPQVTSFAQLNAHLLAHCLADDQRRVKGQPHAIGQAWQIEQPALRPLPDRDIDCAVSRSVTLTPYSQVIFDTNRYSVPADQGQRHLVVKASAFRIQILSGTTVLAEHSRCYGRDQDVFDPLHYLPLLEQRPGAFEHAKPLRRWRAHWPPVYDQALARLRRTDTEGRGIREFVRILRLHQAYPADQVEQALTLALAHGCVHRDGVELCLHHLQPGPALPGPLDLTDRPHLATVGATAPDLTAYDQLLGGR